MNIQRKIITFLKSLAFHVWGGFPKSTQTEIDSRLNICKSCEMFDNTHSQCLVCGCNLSSRKIFMNKLAWADQKCPLDKWGAINRSKNATTTNNK
jgi:uncharacterized paraquat-inducible protein A